MNSSIRIAAISAVLLAASTALFTGCSATPTRQSTGEYIDDAAITTKVKAEFVKDEIVKASAVNVETFKGVVQLSGFVNTSVEKSRAEKLAAGVMGVKSVQNKITVK